MTEFRVLTVQQPYAWAFAYGGKTVENRRWTTRYRGLVAIHAGLQWYPGGEDDPRIIAAWNQWRETLPMISRPHPDTSMKRWLMDSSREWATPRSAIIAVATLTSVCVPGDACDCGEWAEPGRKHHRYENVRPLEALVFCPGSRGLWHPSQQIIEAVSKQLERRR